MSCEIHVDDIGTRFQMTVKDCDDNSGVDISSALAREIRIRKPSDTLIYRSASVFDDGSALSGVMYYDTIAGDLDEVGTYKLQGKISIGSGVYYTSIYTFKVNCNL